MTWAKSMEAIIRTREVLDYADSLRRGNQDAVAALLESATSPTNTVEGIRCLPVCSAVALVLLHPYYHMCPACWVQPPSQPHG